MRMNIVTKKLKSKGVDFGTLKAGDIFSTVTPTKTSQVYIKTSVSSTSENNAVNLSNGCPFWFNLIRTCYKVKADLVVGEIDGK